MADRTRFTKRTAAVILAAAMAVTSLAGCGRKIRNAEGAVATLDGEDVSARLAQFMIRYNQYVFETQSWDYLKQIYGDNTNLWEIDVMGDGTTFWESMKNERMEELKKLLLAEKHAGDAGVTEEDYKGKQDEIKETARKLVSELDKDTAEALCADEDTVAEYLKLMTIQDVVENKVAETADTDVSDEDARQVTVTYAAFLKSGDYTREEDEESVSGDETEAETQAEDVYGAGTEAETEITESVYGAETEAETENVQEDNTALEEAEAFLKSVPDAEGFEAAYTEYVNGFTGSPVMKEEATFGPGDSYPDPAVISAATEIKEDNTLIDHVVEGDEALYVILVTDAEDKEAAEQKKEEIIEEIKSDTVSSRYAEWEKESTWEVNGDVLSQIKADRHFVLPEEEETETSAAETETEAGYIISYAETESEGDGTESVAETAGFETEEDTTEGGGLE